jgi:peptide deformylase
MKILKYGDSRLQSICEPVREITPELKKIIQEMFKVMYESNGIGLAAPQIGVQKRFFIADIGDGQQYVFINPKITNRSDLVNKIEGCLSFPGVFIEVARYKKIFIKAQDIEGKTFKIKATDLLAQVCLHEISHLDGILLTDFAIDKEDLQKQLKDNNLIC